MGQGDFLINLGALGFRRFCVLLVGFLCLSAALYFSLSPDATRREYVSVFGVGMRGIATPIDKPVHLIEYAQLKLLPRIGKDVMGVQQDDVQVVFTNKPGSRFIRIITRADLADAERVEHLHRRLLQALLKHQEQRRLAIREHLIAVQGLHQDLLSAGGASSSKKRLAAIKATLYSATVQLENLTSSEIVEPFSVAGVDKLEARPVRLLLSLLLAFLLIFLLVFLYALLGARANFVSVESFR